MRPGRGPSQLGLNHQALPSTGRARPCLAVPLILTELALASRPHPVQAHIPRGRTVRRRRNQAPATAAVYYQAGMRPSPLPGRRSAGSSLQPAEPSGVGSVIVVVACIAPYHSRAVQRACNTGGGTSPGPRVCYLGPHPKLTGRPAPLLTG